jgi:hypothetical protein
LTTTWSFGDGSTPVFGETANHTYTEPGLYSASFAALDNQGGSVQCVRHVQVGWITEAKILSPAENSLFRAGDSILLVAEQHTNITRCVIMTTCIIVSQEREKAIITCPPPPSPPHTRTHPTHSIICPPPPSLHTHTHAHARRFNECDRRYAWSLSVIHNDHYHPVFDGEEGPMLTYDVEDMGHSYSDRVHIEIVLVRNLPSYVVAFTACT